MLSDPPPPFAKTPPGIVTLHGFAGSPNTFDELKLPVARAFRLPGHGERPDLGARSFSEAVERFGEELLDFDQPPHLLAYSMGARLALWLCLRFPERVHSATLIAPNPGLQEPAAVADRLRWEAQWIRLLEREGIDGFLVRWQALPLFATQQGLSSLLLSRQQEARRAHTVEGLVHALRVCGLAAMPSSWEQLPALRVPVQMLVGERDEKFLDLAERALRLCPTLERKIIAEVGHNLCLEAPQSVRASVLNFLGSKKATEPGSPVVPPAPA